jgi:hypothetical protein
LVEDAMARLIATKPMTYATRRLQAGDAFEAPRRDARILLAIRKAKTAGEASPAPQAPEAPAPAEDADLEALRAEAERLGIDVDGRWGAKRLRAEIDRASKAD